MAEPTRVVLAHRIAENDTTVDAKRSLYDTIAFSSMDWGDARDVAWLYGIVLGWDPDEDDDPEDGPGAMAEIAARFDWEPQQVARLRALHAAFEALRPPPEFPQPAEGTATCLACGCSEHNTSYEQRMDDLVRELRRQLGALQRQVDRLRG